MAGGGCGTMATAETRWRNVLGCFFFRDICVGLEFWNQLSKRNCRNPEEISVPERRSI